MISDFGIATVAHSTRSLDTGGASGTIYYMAPEQIQGRPRPASDQYALGVLVYEWLCGTPPFTGTVMEIGMQHLLTPPPSLSENSEMISHEVEQVVLTALAKDPHQRFESVQAFVDTLVQASRSSIGRNICTYIGYSSALWSYDGKYIASEGREEYAKIAVHILNAKDGKLVHTFRYGFYQTLAIVWKYNIPLIAIVGRNFERFTGEVRLFNALSERLESIVQIHDFDRIVRVYLSPNGEFVTLLFDAMPSVDSSALCVLAYNP